MEVVRKLKEKFIIHEYWYDMNEEHHVRLESSSFRIMPWWERKEICQLTHDEGYTLICIESTRIDGSVELRFKKGSFANREKAYGKWMCVGII